jgi:hypothetical protein
LVRRLRGGRKLIKRSIVWVVLSSCCALAGGVRADTFDGITIFLDSGASPGDVMVQWSGGEPDFTVYRATAPQTIVDPANVIGTTSVRAWNDTPPVGSAFFYKVTSPCVYAPPEVCDGIDNDCDGSIDNGLTPPANNCVQTGPCSGSMPVCMGTAGWKCNYASLPGVETDASGNLMPQEAHCDGIDNNCNGTVDLDGFPSLGTACYAGFGVCQGTGSYICNAAQTGTACTAVANMSLATDELCDGIDNNCDGQIDERTPASGTLKGWVDPMVAVPKPGGGTVYVYTYEASRTDATANSQGGHNSRPCSKAGVLPWTSLTETQAAAACAAIKNSLGNSMRLCTQAEWTAACEGPTGGAASKWSFSVTPTTYLAGVCNDRNAAATPCIWDTGTVTSLAQTNAKFCYTDWASAGRIYDLTGNAAEWTSSMPTIDGQTFGLYMGGLFAFQSGDTCEYASGTAPPTFASPVLGFRCCSDNAP